MGGGGGPAQPWLYSTLHSACKLSRDFYGNYKVQARLTVITGPRLQVKLSAEEFYIFLYNQQAGRQIAESNDVMTIQNVKMETFFNNSDKLLQF